MNFDFPYVLEVIPAIMKYVPLTLFMSILAMAVAILIGILLAVMKESKKAVLRGFTSIYLSFFRSVPTLVLLFIIVPIIGAVARGVLGRKLGALATGAGVGWLAFVVTASWLLALVAAALSLFIALLGGVSGALPSPRSRGGPWGGGFGGGGLGGGGFGGGSFGSGGGGFSSGGGDFGGGGASGSW